MPVPKPLYGVTRQIPVEPEKGWGGLTGTITDLVDQAEAGTFRQGGAILPYAPVADLSVAAGATVSPTAREIRVSGTPGAVQLSASAAIADGFKAGQQLRLKGGANAVTILHGANVRLNGNIVLEEGETLDLEWDAALGDWVEIGRSN